MCRYTLTLLLWLALAAPCLFAESLLDPFGDRTEADIAAEFEAGLVQWFSQRLANPTPPQITLTPARGDPVLVQLVAVDTDTAKTTWEQVVVVSRLDGVPGYGYRPDPIGGARHEVRVADLPAVEVGMAYSTGALEAGALIALSVWLRHRGQPIPANGMLARLVRLDGDYRARVEAYLCERHEWQRPADGLTEFQTHDLEWRRSGGLLMTPDAHAQHAKDSLRAAVTAYENLHGLAWRGRNWAPQLPLDMLADRAERFEQAWGFTGVLDQRSRRAALKQLMDLIKEYRQAIETGVLAADRLSSDGKYEESAQEFRRLLVLDPRCDPLISKTARALLRAAEVQPSGNSSRNPRYAEESAKLWDRMSEIFPTAAGYQNLAGQAWRAASQPRLARERFTGVVKRLEALKELDPGREAELAYARRHLDELSQR